VARMRAIETMRRWPEDSVRTSRSRRCCMCRRTYARSRSCSVPPYRDVQKRRFWWTVSSALRPSLRAATNCTWPLSASLCRCGGTGTPFTANEPAVGRRNPAASRRRVVLPAPLGPRSSRPVPRRSEKLTSRSTGVAPRAYVRPRAANASGPVRAHTSVPLSPPAPALCHAHTPHTHTHTHTYKRLPSIFDHVAKRLRARALAFEMELSGLHAYGGGAGVCTRTDTDAHVCVCMRGDVG
jgi:hypothetical protein